MGLASSRNSPRHPRPCCLESIQTHRKASSPQTFLRQDQVTDPFLDSATTYHRLYTEYLKHKSLIVALDFDQTINDCHNKGYEFPKVIELIKDCNAVGFRVVIFSGSARERYPAIREHCEKLGIKIDGINEDLIDWHPDKSLDWSKSKIYYNIFLDDRAGLDSAYKVLRLLVSNVKSEMKLP